jgi:hypothetical protein
MGQKGELWSKNLNPLTSGSKGGSDFSPGQDLVDPYPRVPIFRSAGGIWAPPAIKLVC